MHCHNVTLKFGLSHISETVRHRQLIFGWVIGMQNHGVIFNVGSTKECSPAIYETYFSYQKDIWIAVTSYYYIHFGTISIDSYTSIYNSYSFTMLSLLINAVILILNCLVLILYLYIHFLC